MASPPCVSPSPGLTHATPQSIEAPDAALSLPAVLTFSGITVLNHVALTGARVTISLAALSWGMSTLAVGVLVSLFAVLPMLLSIRAGQWVDYIGAGKPMRVGTGLIILGVTVPVIWPAWPALAFASSAIGIGFMLQQLSAQTLLGQGVGAVQRTANFAWLALGNSVSGFAGPLIAGFAIDGMGHRAALAVLIVSPILAMVSLIYQPHRLPHSVARPTRVSSSSAKTHGMLRDPLVRRILLSNLLLAAAWDFHMFMIPILGIRLGFSATTIGLILGCFGAAIFAIRLVLPLIQRRVQPWTLVRASTVLAAVVYLLFPFATTVPWLMGLSFVLGLAVGSCQPSMLALMYQYAPAGRASEALGLRMAALQGSQVGIPLSFGAVGAAIGLTPLFCAMGLCLLAGAIPRPPPDEQDVKELT
jgi:predicted MFS family arabinose efflux permease